MGFLKKLFGLEKQQLQNTVNDVVITRGPKAVSAEPGKEAETFLLETAEILKCKPMEIDLNRDLQKEYDCDELDVVEIIQIAEDVWNAQLMANPITIEDCERALSEYRTLSKIMDQAQRNPGM
jgi:hypothetical protein